MTTKQISMSDPNFDTICKFISDCFPNSCVCWIEEITNSKVQSAFDKKLVSLKKSRPEVSVKRLFHGTKERFIDSIVQSGFDPYRNKVSAFGKGTYFATDPRMSLRYTDISKSNQISYVFLCDVIVGNTVQGMSNRYCDTEKYDNFVDNVKNPKIYVSPYHDGAVPMYVIAFYKNVK